MSAKEILNFSSIQPEKNRKKVSRQGTFLPLERPEGYGKETVRVGRGRSSGCGKTSGRGQKGQRSRTGYSRRAGFEGGQMPLHRRLPKRGFTNIFRKEIQLVNLWRMEKAGVSGTLNPEDFQKSGLVNDATKLIKVLGSGEISKPVNVTADYFSESAKKKIEAAGGSCTLRTSGKGGEKAEA